MIARHPVIARTTSRTTFRARTLCLVASIVFLNACAITTSDRAATNVSSGAPSSAAVSRAGSARIIPRLTRADVSVPEASGFVGQSEDILALHFGAPALTRREGEATIHQFKTGAASEACVILAVVYQDRGDVPRIRHLSVRRGPSEAAEPDQCIRAVALANRTRQAG